jgi:Kef-type K+ transport system membrane component KefB
MVFVPWILLKITRLEKYIPLPVAQITFGICFGAGALGSMWPEIWNTVFPQPIRFGLDAIQILAISIFAFIAGIELKPREIIDREGAGIWRQSVQIILVPIVLTTVCFMLFFNNATWYGPDVPFWKYAWAMGVATCVTAMPMLVVACKSLGIWGTHTSKKLLGLVTFDDLVLWLTVAFLISLGQYAMTSVVFFSIFAVIWYVWPKILDRAGEDSWPSLIVAMVLSMAAFSHWAGLHYVLGAFLAGMITPKKTVSWNHGMDFQQMYWLMPVFFIWTGLKLNWTLDFEIILLAAIGMFGIAITTKFIGVWLAFRDQGIRTVCYYTALLQNKGLMEILLAGMLLTSGIISDNMFAAVVIMSLISTLLAVPMAKLFHDPRQFNK